MSLHEHVFFDGEQFFWGTGKYYFIIYNIYFCPPSMIQFPYPKYHFKIFKQYIPHKGYFLFPPNTKWYTMYIYVDLP